MTRLGAGNTLLFSVGLLALLATGCPRKDFDLGGITAGSSGSGNGAAGSAGSSNGNGNGNGNGGAGQRCGSRGLPECRDGFFCSYAESAQCGDADAPGTCKRIPEVCTRIYAPVCGCDGETYGNSCEAEGNGVSVRRQGECEPAGGKVCGGLTGAACADDEFCNYPPDAICGAADATGVCEARPEVCADIYKPVCGCDGKTYGNACEANGAGVSVASEGECAPPGGGKSCGGLVMGDNRCAAGEFCDYPIDAICGAADAPGVCREKPQGCTFEYAPVCGCDGNTYGNKCAAAAAGVSVSKEGECENTGGAVCGVRGAAECADGEFCNFPEGSQCAAADVPGKCTKKPDACTLELREVCGCDGKTYGNPCLANIGGTSVAHDGACEGAGQTCGGLTGAQCPAEEFCNYPISAQCGAADQTGTCSEIPQACTREYRPVCGCDDKTYGNPCMAAAAGISIASEGECQAVGEVCGGLTGAQCSNAEQFCLYPLEAQCGAADQTGVCTDKPQVCTADYRPVCGCNDKTYGNACAAHGEGISVAAEGECK